MYHDKAVQGDSLAEDLDLVLALQTYLKSEKKVLYLLWLDQFDLPPSEVLKKDVICDHTNLANSGIIWTKKGQYKPKLAQKIYNKINNKGGWIELRFFLN